MDWSADGCSSVLVPVVPAPGGTLRSGGSSLVRESLLQRRAVVTAVAGVVTGDSSPLALASIDVEQPRQMLDHRAAQFFGVHNRHRPAVITRHVVADADPAQLNRRAIGRAHVSTPITNAH